MRLLFLHGAIKNAGDFLIAERSKNLINLVFPDAEITSVWEGQPLDKRRDYLSGFDCIVFGGGPFFTHHIYPQDIPLCSEFISSGVPCINIGGGWFGSSGDYDVISKYFIDSTSLELLNKIENDAKYLSCRDYSTVKMLKHKGFNACMTGCPAWYDPKYIELDKLQLKSDVKKICISDPASYDNYPLVEDLIKWMKLNFKDVDITFLFHRGDWNNSDSDKERKQKNNLKKILEKYQVKSIDISGSSEGFNLYDQADLHIGFRVHAHIYNLSHRKFSILIEEDGRAAGVNEVLGLTSVRAYKKKYSATNDSIISKIKSKISYEINTNFTEEIALILEQVYANDGLDYECAFRKMQYYYQSMIHHINKIDDICEVKK